MALSFQDNAGCLDIWRQITRVQSRAAEWYSSKEQHNSSVTDMAHAVAAAHHASLQRQQQHTMWEHVASEAAQVHYNNNSNNNNNTEEYSESAEAVAVNMAAAAAAAYGNHHSSLSESSSTCSLPNPPTLQNLEEIADIIAAAQVRRVYSSMHTHKHIYICMHASTYISILLFFWFMFEKSNSNNGNHWQYTCRETTAPTSKPCYRSFPRPKRVAITGHSPRWPRASRPFCS